MYSPQGQCRYTKGYYRVGQYGTSSKYYLHMYLVSSFSTMSVVNLNLYSGVT